MGKLVMIIKNIEKNRLSLCGVWELYGAKKGTVSLEYTYIVK